PIGEAVPAPADTRLVVLRGEAGRIGGPERDKRLLGIHVGRALGEDRQDQLRRRVEAALPDLRAVELAQPVERVVEEARPIPGETPRPGDRRVRLRPLALLRFRLGPGLRLRRRWGGGGRSSRAHDPDDAATRPPTDTRRAILSPQRSTGSVPAAIASSTDWGRSTTGTTAAPTDARASMPVGVTPPPTPMHGTSASAARRATPSAVLPKAVCSSI